MNERRSVLSSQVQSVYTRYRKAQIDYNDLYIHMYIAYNAWYRQVTGTTNDREALAMLKERFVIWDDYCQGKTLTQLHKYLNQLAKLTTEKPVGQQNGWKGTIENAYDWRGLIEYWYFIRCRLVHGSAVPRRHVWLAYETLDIFMSEIVDRMQSCFTQSDLERMQELSMLVRTEHTKVGRFKQLQQKLHTKYINSPDIWQVDMQRVL